MRYFLLILIGGTAPTHLLIRFQAVQEINIVLTPYPASKTIAWIPARTIPHFKYQIVATALFATTREHVQVINQVFLHLREYICAGRSTYFKTNLISFP